ncbi:Vitamin B12 import ATP-binding protein BtuD [subsurface metagenome]
MNAIRTENLSKIFDNRVRAVSNLSLSVDKGEIFGFLGPNGAGKTTTIRLLNGTLTPTRGKSFILDTESQDEKIRLKTSTLAEMAQMYENMSVYENLLFFSTMYDIPKKEADRRIEELLEKMQLWEKKNLKLGSFSTGMKKRVYLARTLLHRPEIIFLDEPTVGLDPEAALQVTRLIRRLAGENNTTIFLCTHNLFLAERICDTFGFISSGELVACGKKEELINSNIREKKVEIKTLNGRFIFPYADEAEINGLISRVQNQGESIFEVKPLRPSLEEVYFHYIGRQNHELV